MVSLGPAHVVLAAVDVPPLVVLGRLVMVIHACLDPAVGAASRRPPPPRGVLIGVLCCLVGCVSMKEKYVQYSQTHTGTVHA